MIRLRLESCFVQDGSDGFRDKSAVNRHIFPKEKRLDTPLVLDASNGWFNVSINSAGMPGGGRKYTFDAKV